MYFGIFSKGNVQKTSPLLNKPAPGFDLVTFEGESLNLEELRGNVVVINFWASWCIPCVKEVRILDRAYDRFSDKPVKILGVNIWDEKDAASEFMSIHNVRFPNLYDPENRIQVDYGVGGVPETFFIDKNGILVEKYSGELTENILNYFVNEVLNN